MAKKKSRASAGKKRTASSARRGSGSSASVVSERGAVRRGRPSKAEGGGGGGDGGDELSGLSVMALQAELARRERQLASYQRRRSKLLDELEVIEREMSQLGSLGAGGRRGGGPRARNSETLVDAIASTLGNSTMGVNELVDAVQRNGYRTTSPNFRTIVNQTLIKHTDRFKRVSRGQYAVV